MSNEVRKSSMQMLRVNVCLQVLRFYNWHLLAVLVTGSAWSKWSASIRVGSLAGVHVTCGLFVPIIIIVDPLLLSRG